MSLEEIPRTEDRSDFEYTLEVGLEFTETAKEKSFKFSFCRENMKSPICEYTKCLKETSSLRNYPLKTPQYDHKVDEKFLLQHMRLKFLVSQWLEVSVTKSSKS